MCLVSGLHLCQHVAAPDELVLRVQPPGVGGEGRRRAQEELRCGRDPQEHAVPQALQEIRPQDPRENSRPRVIFSYTTRSITARTLDARIQKCELTGHTIVAAV